MLKPTQLVVEINMALNHLESVECYLRATVDGADVEKQYWVLQAKRAMAALQAKMEDVYREVL